VRVSIRDVREELPELRDSETQLEKGSAKTTIWLSLFFFKGPVKCRIDAQHEQYRSGEASRGTKMSEYHTTCEARHIERAGVDFPILFSAFHGFPIYDCFCAIAGAGNWVLVLIVSCSTWTCLARQHPRSFPNFFAVITTAS
jgi:hypothetical protein